jgi:hypothetical protein
LKTPAERADARETGGGIHHHEQHLGFVVIESKASGREVVVGRCDDEATARSVLRLLSWAGAVARIERAS